MTTIVNAEAIFPPQLIASIAGKLRAHRAALQDLESSYQALSQYSVSDFEALPSPMSPTDAQALFNALTDAHNEYVNYTLGLPANLPATGYKYGTSQTTLIGF